MFVAVLLALPVFAQRVAVPKAMPRVAAPAMIPSRPPLPLSSALHSAALPAPLLAPSLPAVPSPALAVALLAAALPAASEAPPPDGLLGRTAKALATVPPGSQDWDREVFEEMFSGRYKGPKPWTDIPDSPKVAVGATLVDRRAPGARELLKTLLLPHDPPVLGVFKRQGERVLNGVALGTHGVRGHKDILPPGLERRDYGGYTLGLRPDGSLLLAGSGHLPADMTARLLRNLRRYYGLTPARESVWARAKRGLWALWDALNASV